MTDKNFGNGYDHNATIRFFKKWWKLLTWVFVLAIAASVVVSLLITPRYKSTATLFPTNSNRLSKAIMDYHYSLDFMDYGIERDCEYCIQILSSESMERDVCAHFNLMEHYGISPDDPHKMFKLHEQYRGNVNVKRTEFLGVEVGVLDVDPEWAANIANFIASNYDTVCHRIHHDRACDAANIMDSVCQRMGLEIQLLQDSLRRNPQYQLGLTQLINEKCAQLADLQTRAAQTQVDMNENVSYKFMLDQAVPADKKAYPKRSIIVLLGAFGSLVMCIMVLLLMDALKKDEE
ncbi:MAG: hypothetical protein KBT28_09540 [Bacteroidales bacterium]|nr:hypothetical protein [Candidatus Colimorpha merdihippi]